MSLIEGVGDEVTVFAVILLLVILVITFIFWTSGAISSISDASTSRLADDSVQQSSNETLEERLPSQENPLQTCSKNTDSSNVTKETDSVENSDHGVDFDLKPISNETAPTTNGTVNEQNHTAPSLYPHVQHSNSPSAPEMPMSEENSENISSQPGQIRVRLKYLDDTDRMVISNLTEKIIDFKRAHFPEELANNKIIKLIYNGQLLQDNCTLSFSGIDDNCVVHVHISQARTPQNTQTVSPNADLDLSHLLWPLVSVILGIIWVLYFKYPDFFSVMSIGILVLFTGSFIYFYSMAQNR